MRSPMILFPALLALAACSGGAQNTGAAVSQDAAIASQALLPPAKIAAMQQACAAAAPTLAVASSPSVAALSPVAAKLAGTAIYGGAYCQQLLSGTVPATTDASTPAWLATVLAATADTAQIANVVLPVALKALPLVMAVL